MKLSDALNAGLLALCLLASTLGVVVAGGPTNIQTEPPALKQLPSKVVVDARGQSISVRAYQRVVSLNLVADPILLELIEPSRLLGISEHTRSSSPFGYRFGSRPGIVSHKKIESILNLDPDLVVVSSYAGEASIARLREAGVSVFDLGSMRGVQDTIRSIDTLAQLLKVEHRGDRLRQRYSRNLVALEKALDGINRPKGIWLSVLGDSLFGGTDGSSYSDLLWFGGVADQAEMEGYVGWPRYSPEQLLELDPHIIVTRRGSGSQICEHSVLFRLSACAKGKVVELSSRLHSDPGLGLVDAAQELQTVVHNITPKRTFFHR